MPQLSLLREGQVGNTIRYSEFTGWLFMFFLDREIGDNCDVSFFFFPLPQFSQEGEIW